MSRWAMAVRWWARPAIEFAEQAHRGQFRRGTGEPSINHPLRVAEARFRENAIAAALFHDLIEDTPVTLNDIGCKFSMSIANIVAACTEIKLAADGRPIPWAERRRAHLDRLRAKTPHEVRAVMLADKLDNLRRIGDDLAAGRPVWDLFHAGRDDVLRYHDAMVAACDSEHRQVHMLADQCRRQLDRIRLYEVEKLETSAPTT